MKQHQQNQAQHSKLLPFPNGADTAENAANAADTAENLTAYTAYSVKDLEKIFEVKARQVRNYASTVKEAYYWLEEEGCLKVGNQYSQTMVDKIWEFRNSGLTIPQWIKQVHKQNPDRFVEPEASLPAIPIIKPEVLALYDEPNQVAEVDSNHNPSHYFLTSSYSDRYRSTKLRVTKQRSEENNFANKLLSQFADIAEDTKAWNQAESEKQNIQDRQATLKGLTQALRDFSNETTAYRHLKHKLDSGEISPEQATLMLEKLQGQNQKPGKN